MLSILKKLKYLRNAPIGSYHLHKDVFLYNFLKKQKNKDGINNKKFPARFPASFLPACVKSRHGCQGDRTYAEVTVGTKFEV